MAIIRNDACPKCRKGGHDKTGDHLIVFDNGNAYCSRSHFHKNGKPYWQKGDGKKVVDGEINGLIKYTIEQFRELEDAGKLKNPDIRLLALGGMREELRYEVSTDKEQREMEKQWDRELALFSSYSVRNLVSRGIEGAIAKLYNVRVGLGKDGKVNRHFYPIYDEDMELVGAKCRNLPKDFTTGKLGRTWGPTKLFGQNTGKAVADSGGRRDVLLIVGGECDAMAAQQMLCESRKNTKWEGNLFHVWSVTKGEYSIKEIADNLKHIRKFNKVILAFDNDEVGRELTIKASQLIREKAHVLQYPEGCKDANQCLLEDRDAEFVDAWWNAGKPEVSSIKTISDLWEEATAAVEMGISWPWPSVTKETFGIRFHNLYVIGGGPGVGKTEIAKEVIQHLTDFHDELVGIIFMEEPAPTTARVLAGKYINKKLHLPKNEVKKGHPDYDEGRDYTEEDAVRALTYLKNKNKIRIADCKGDTTISNILAMMEQLRAMGCKYIFIDNLTTISHEGKEGSVKAIDESMKRFGTYMQEEDVAIFLLSHLAKPDENRTPYEEGGVVRLGDFRGSQSIAFWATFMLAVERNTVGDAEEKLITYLRCVKDRLTGQATGKTVLLRGNTKTGRLLEPEGHTQARDKVKAVSKKGKSGDKNGEKGDSSRRNKKKTKPKETGDY